MSASKTHLRVGIIGGGRVGAVLGSALRSLGHTVTGVSGDSQQTRERTAAMLPGVEILPIPDVVTGADLVLCAVPDDAIAELISGLAKLGVWKAGQILMHTSGKYGTAVLAPATAQGVLGFAVHPAMTFTGSSMDLLRLQDCPFAVTAPATILPIAQALVIELGGHPIVLSEEQRAAYHAALSHGANHLVTLVNQSASILKTAGISEAAQLLTPLLEAALEGALTYGEASMQTITGPVSRGDSGTIAAHVQALADLETLEAAIPNSERDLDYSVSGVLQQYQHLAADTARRLTATRKLSKNQLTQILEALNIPDGPQSAEPAPEPTKDPTDD